MCVAMELSLAVRLNSTCSISGLGGATAGERETAVAPLAAPTAGVTGAEEEFLLTETPPRTELVQPAGRPCGDGTRSSAPRRHRCKFDAGGSWRRGRRP